LSFRNYYHSPKRYRRCGDTIIVVRCSSDRVDRHRFDAGICEHCASSSSILSKRRWASSSSALIDPVRILGIRVTLNVGRWEYQASHEIRAPLSTRPKRGVRTRMSAARAASDASNAVRHSRPGAASEDAQARQTGSSRMGVIATPSGTEMTRRLKRSALVLELGGLVEERALLQQPRTK
jgi:hypothetical protein